MVILRKHAQAAMLTEGNQNQHRTVTWKWTCKTGLFKILVNSLPRVWLLKQCLTFGYNKPLFRAGLSLLTIS